MIRTLTGSELVYHCLYNLGIRKVTGYSGGAVLPLLDRFYKKTNANLKYNYNDDIQSEIQFIKSSNEQCAGHIMEGYACAKNKQRPGVIISTSGPGVTNILTPLQNAYNDGTPLIAITGQVPTTALGTDAFQECPATDITRASTKWNKIVLDVNEIPNIIHRAFFESMEGRKGPVHIDIPKDILTLSSEYYYSYLEVLNYSSAYNRLLEEKEIKLSKTINNDYKTTHNKICDAIHKSKRPIILVGQGANDAYKEVRELSERLQIPVATTIHGMGIVDEQSRLSMKMMGMHGSAATNFAIQEADLVIGIGTRFDDRIIGNIDKYAPKTNISEGGYGIVHIDNSLEQINKVDKLFSKFKDDKDLMSLNTPSKEFLKDTLKYFKLVDKTHNPKTHNKWQQRIIDLKNDYQFKEHNYSLKEEKSYNPEIYTTGEAIASINKYIDILNLDRSKITYTTGVGNHQMFTAQHITWTHPGKMITSGSLGTMGVGVPFALGVKIAKPEEMVICIDGDGSFCMTSSELQTVAELNIPIKICIMNDKRQQMVHIWQKLFFKERYVGTDNKNPDFTKLAEAYNIKSVKCSRKSDLQNVTKYMLEYNEGPILVEFNVEPDICLPLVSPGKSLSEMIINEEDIEKTKTLSLKDVPS